MKTRIQRLFLMLVCTGLLAMPVAAQAQFNFTTNNGAITITGYSGGGVVVIPGTTNGFPVTSIADNAFYNSTLTSVTIPISVTSIGNSAFAYCYGLTNIIIPNSVTSIGNTAFEYDYYLTSVTVGSGVTSIGFNAFAVCGSLTGAYFLGNRPPDNGTAFYEDSSATVFYLTGSIGWGSTFGGVSTALSQSQFNYAILNDTIAITGYTGPGGNVVIPATIIGLPVTIIGNGAFQYNYSLTNLTIGPNVTSIGQYVFVDCSSLTNVLIGSSVTNIGDYAFLECTSLRNLAIPDSVLNIGYDTFADCLSLTNVLIGNGVTQIGDYAFYSCRSLVSAYFQGNAPPDDGTVFSEDSSTIVYYLRGTTGWDSTFGGAPTTLSQPQFNYTINNGAITIIGYNGSSGNVVIPAAINGLPVASIGNGAFSYNAGLTNLSIPNSITNIGYQACYNCINLASVTIPNSVTGIGAYAFAFCHSLTGVIIPNSVISIGDYAFAECSSLIYAYFQGNAPPDDGTVFYADGGDSVYYLRGTTGWGSTFGSVPTAMSLSQFDYTVNNGTVSITGYAGSGGMAVIPDTVNGLPVTSIGEFAFDGYGNLTSVTIGTNVASIGEYAFFNCVSLTNVTIGANVNNIGNYAFAYCSSLTSAYFQGNAPSNNGTAFYNDSATVYYLSGTTGWGSTFGNVPAVLSQPQFNYALNNGAITITGYTGPGGNVVIPASINGFPVTSIGSSAFFDNTSLTGVTIPNSIISIGYEAFFDDSSLATVTIPGSVTGMGDYAFYGCSSLTAADFQGNAPPDDGTVFVNDFSTIVYYLRGTTGWGSTFGEVSTAVSAPQFIYTVNNGAITITGYIGPGGNIVIPDAINGLPVTSIGGNAFYNKTSLTSVTIPNSVANIGDYAFTGCSSLTSAYFQGNAPLDDGMAFYGDNGITTAYYLSGVSGWGSTFGSVPTAMSLSQFDYTVNNGTVSITGYAGSGGMAVIPDTVNGLPVTSIGYAAFFYNASLTGLTIGGNVTSIGNYAFTGCTSLTNITVDASNPAYSSLNGVLFDKALAALLLFPPGLGGSYKIPNSVTSIGDSSFYRCSLTNVTIPNSVVSIGSYVFENSSLLTNVTIGANVNNIGNYAFAYCSSLTSAYFQGNAPSNNGTAFYNDSATVYYLSGTTGWGSTFGGVLAVLLNPPSAFSLSIALTNMSFTAQAQNLFESDLNSGNIYEFITNGTPSTFASGLSGPIGLAFNSAGNLFELDSGSGSIYEFTNNAGTLSSNYIIFASGLNNPRGLAFDKNGNLFVANTGGQNILEFTNNAGALSTSYIIFASGLTGPLALAFNSAGNLFVSDAGTATYNSAHIYEYTPLGAQSTISALPTQPFGLAFDSAGDLFVTDVGNNLSGSGIIYEFTNNAGALSSNYAIFASGLWYPEGLAFDSAGNLFESDGGSDNIFELTNCVAAEKGTFASGLNHPSGLAFSPIVTNSTFSVSIKMFAEIILKNGQIGSNYLIQATANLSSSNWTTLTNITLPSQTYIYIDYSSYTNSKQFYRAVLQ